MNRSEKYIAVKNIVANRESFQELTLSGNLHRLYLSGKSILTDTESVKVLKNGLYYIIKYKEFFLQLIFYFNDTGFF